MKTFLRFMLAACLILCSATGGLAAVHSFQEGGYFGDFFPAGEAALFETELFPIFQGDRFFTVEDQGQRFEAALHFDITETNLIIARAEYYQNDFVFGDLMYLEAGTDNSNFRGGYLWEDLGLFVGIDYVELFGSGYIVSGGYRFGGGSNYAALSLNYYGSDYGGFYELEAHAKYLADGLKLTGQLDVDVTGGYMLRGVRGKANLAASDDLTWGGGFYLADGGTYRMAFAGLTWESGGFLVDSVVSFNHDSGDSIYYLGGMYDISDSLAAGIGYVGSTDSSSGILSLKGEYLMGEGTLDFSYTTFTDGSGGGIVGIGYEMPL